MKDFAALAFSVQKRTHRKSRINKKWLKKYGSKFVVTGNYFKIIDPSPVEDLIDELKALTNENNEVTGE